MAEPVIADAVRPIAEKILDNQEKSNLQDYNKRFDSFKQVSDSMAALQHRDDSKLERIPDLERGTENSVISDQVIQPWEVVYNNAIPVKPELIIEVVAEEVVKPLAEKLDLLDGTKFDPQNDPNLSQSHLDEVNKQWLEYNKARQDSLQETKKRTVVKLILPVKQMFQWDSKTENGNGMCASSVMSMAINFLSPGLITQEMLKEAGWSQLDDFYLKELIEKNGGKTTDPQFHIKVLNALGFRAELSTHGSWDLIDRQLHEGIPVPMAIAHHGHVSRPNLEKWHWILCRGKTEDPKSKAHIFNDPWGELDVVNGGYDVGPRGTSIQYTDKNLTPRWQTDGPNRGWCVLFKRPFPTKLKGG